jgi:hypothetical protein
VQRHRERRHQGGVRRAKFRSLSQIPQAPTFKRMSRRPTFGRGILSTRTSFGALNKWIEMTEKALEMKSYLIMKRDESHHDIFTNAVFRRRPLKRLVSHVFIASCRVYPQNRAVSPGRRK